jgi:ABC-2 type transport system ATP-binding protein
MIESGEVVVSGCPEDIANSYSLYNFQNNNSKDTERKGVVFPKGLCKLIPKLEVTSKSKAVLRNDDVFECSIDFELTQDKSVGVAVSLIDAASNRSLIDDRSFYLSERLIPVAKKMGEHSIDLSVELSDFNQGEFLLSATVYIIGGDGSDEFNREWVAFTYSDRAARFKVNNVNKVYSRNNGILNRRLIWSIEKDA